MKLVFYSGPGNAITKTIRMLTDGPYSHVELQFSNGGRFFSSGHGLHQGSHFLYDQKVYSRFWDSVTIPATSEEEKAVQRCALSRIGMPFDWRGMLGFLLPYVDRRRKAKYCSSIILDVLQSSLHMFPGVDLKISPNGLYKLVSAQASPATLHTDDRYLTPQPVPSDASTDSRELVIQAQLHELAGALGAPRPNIEMPVNAGVRR